MLFLFIHRLSALNDDDFLLTEDLVNKINNNPSSSFKAKLYPQFEKMRVRDFKKFLSPIRKNTPSHKSAIPNVKAYFPLHETDFPDNQFYITGINMTFHQNSSNYSIDYELENDVYKVPIRVFDFTQFCSSWAPTVTTAMSMTLSRWSNSMVNLSVQFLLDCDILGDPCFERNQISAYEQFWRRYIPLEGQWRNYTLEPPTPQLTRSICDTYNECYPGQTHCKRQLVLTGVCGENVEEFGVCPIYYLYNWKMIESCLFEVGAVTSSIFVTETFFLYKEGIFDNSGTESNPAEAIGMLDVTIIGWGSFGSDHPSSLKTRPRYWYVNPNFGVDWGMNCSELFNEMRFNSTKIMINGEEKGKRVVELDFGNGRVCNSNTFEEDNVTRTGIMRFLAQKDLFGIESNAVSAVPYNYMPKI